MSARPAGGDRGGDAASPAAAVQAEAEVAAFAKVISQYHDDMARVSFVVSGDVELAGDAARGAWPEAWKHRATPRSAARIRPWLLALAAKEAKWLSDAEKDVLEAALAREHTTVPVHPSLRALAADGRLWRMSLIYFACVVGSYGLTFWMPTLIQEAGVRDVLSIGLLTAIPYGVSVIVMLLTGRHGDRTRERRWHTAAPMIAGAAGLIASAFAGTHTVTAMICLTIAAAGIVTAAPLFWSLPTAILRGTAAAAGIAAINSVGNLGGFVSPYMIGGLKDLTQSTTPGMCVVSALLVAGAVVVLGLPARMVNH